jgi:porin
MTCLLKNIKSQFLLVLLFLMSFVFSNAWSTTIIDSRKSPFHKLTPKVTLHDWEGLATEIVYNRPQDYWMQEDGIVKKLMKEHPFEEHGIYPRMNWVSDMLGNPVGGKKHGFREFDNLFLSLDADLSKSIHAPGTKFHTSFSQRSGTNLSQRDIGNIFNVAQVCCGATFRVVDFYLEQPFDHERLNIRMGRVAAGDEFLASPLYGLFVQNAIDGNPVSIFYNAPGMTAYPTATWGTRIRVRPVEQWELMMGFYNGDPTLGENDKHGMDWSMRGPPFGLIELRYRANQEADAKGLPGNYKVGTFYDGGGFKDFLYDITGGLAPVSHLPNRRERGNTGYYILLDQMIYREDPFDKKQGVTPFVSFIITPNQDISLMPFFVNGGVVYKGPFHSRPRDAIGFGVIYGSISQRLREAQSLQHILDPSVLPQQYELAFEGTYLIKVNDWLKIQPDIQYIVNPGATGTIPNALVVGAQLGVTII